MRCFLNLSSSSAKWRPLIERAHTCNGADVQREVQQQTCTIAPLVSLEHPAYEPREWCQQSRSRFTQGSALSDLPDTHTSLLIHRSHLFLAMSSSFFPSIFPQESICPLSGPWTPSCQTILLHYCQPHQCSRDDAREETLMFQSLSPDIYLSPVPLGYPSTLPCSMKITQCLFSAYSESGLLSLLTSVYRLCPRLPNGGLISSLCLLPCLAEP